MLCERRKTYLSANKMTSSNRCMIMEATSDEFYYKYNVDVLIMHIQNIIQATGKRGPSSTTLKFPKNASAMDILLTIYAVKILLHDLWRVYNRMRGM